MDFQIYIFQKQEAAFVLSIGGSSGAKDFLWRKNRETSFIVLCDSGQLYHGNMKDDLKSIMDGVEAGLFAYLFVFGIRC